MENGEIILKPKDDYGDYSPNTYCGQRDNRVLMIHPDSVLRIIKRFCADIGEPFPYTTTTIIKALDEEGLIERGRNSATKVTNINGHSKRLLYIYIDKAAKLVELPSDPDVVL